jgi:hypothetical protein
MCSRRWSSRARSGLISWGEERYDLALDEDGRLDGKNRCTGVGGNGARAYRLRPLRRFDRSLQPGREYPKGGSLVGALPASACRASPP